MQSISANLSSQSQVFVVLSVFFTCSWQRETDPLRLHWYSLESARPESIFVSHPFINVPSDTSQLLKLLMFLLFCPCRVFLYLTFIVPNPVSLALPRSGYDQNFSDSCVFMLNVLLDVCALAY